MNKGAYCLDTSVLVKVLVPEEGSDEATALIRQAIASGCRLVAPAFAWAEVGTTLRKKVRAQLLTQPEANTAWVRFTSLAIEYIDDPRVPERAWQICSKFDLPTMYDASFLAVCDSVAEASRSAVEFWTADRELVKSLGYAAPQYVRLLDLQR
jgi:predicted nucleic acid-binding protein